MLASNESRETKADAGKLFVYNAVGKINVEISSFGYTAGFVPEPKGVYEVSYGAVETGCIASIRKQSGNGW